MSQEIINLIASWAPSIAAVATIIMSVFKIIKSLTSQYDTLKKEFSTKLKDLQQAQTKGAELNLELSTENKALKEAITKLTKDLDINKELQESIMALKNQVNTLSESIKDEVDAKLQQGFDGIAQMKSDMQKIGETYGTDQTSNTEA